MQEKYSMLVNPKTRQITGIHVEYVHRADGKAIAAEMIFSTKSMIKSMELSDRISVPLIGRSEAAELCSELRLVSEYSDYFYDSIGMLNSKFNLLVDLHVKQFNHLCAPTEAWVHGKYIFYKNVNLQRYKFFHFEIKCIGSNKYGNQYVLKLKK